MAEMHPLEKFFVNSRLFDVFHKHFGVQKLLCWAPPKGKKVLELGCGVGITTKLIAKALPYAEIIALDYDAAQIKEAQKLKLNNVTFVIGDAAHLHFHDEHFDTVIQVLTFHHIPEYQKAMKEAYRVLKKGGHFLMLDMAGKLVNPLHLWLHIQPAEFTKKAFLQDLEHAGFHIGNKKGPDIYFFVDAVKR